MTDEHFDQAFERMRTELNVTPSPEFVAKVRRHNEQLPSRSAWSLWTWAGATATCAAVVIAAVVWRSPAPESRAQMRAQVVRDPAPPSAAQNPGGTAAVPQAPVVTRAVRTGSAPAPKPAIVATPASTELDVLVPPDQLIAIRQLMASQRTRGDSQVALPQMLIDPETGNLLTPKPIEIPLITVTPLPGDPERRSGGRENR